jgi:isoleucyl-tRNA synthetase
MPYAQWGYPFSKSQDLASFFPADFIAEGLDQTRAWFYTLMVLSTALFDQPAFKHVVVNGLILAEDGKKMSKSLRNYPDPTEILNRHGADALRLYLIHSPVVKAQELKFSEDGVKEIVRKILLRWWNAYAFFVNYANVDGFLPRQDFASSPNILDQWILSKLHSLIANTKTEMEHYRLYQVVPKLLEFIEQLTNTYIRFNRNHFWQEEMPEDKRLAYETLYEVLLTLTKVMAPFAPFLSETMFLNLTSVLAHEDLSVHLQRYPVAETKWIQPDLEASVKILEALVTLGRNQREQLGIKSKIPLKRIRIIHRNQEVLANLKRFEPYFSRELNVQEVLYDSDEDACIHITSKACFPILGKRLGSKMKEIAKAIENLSQKEISILEEGKSLTLLGEDLTLEDVEIRRKAKLPHIVTHPLISIELDPTVTPQQMQEGLAREIIRKIQSARKSARLKLNDRMELQIHCQGALAEAVQAYQEKICQETLSIQCSWVAAPQGQHLETTEIEGSTLRIGLRVV